MRRISDRHVYLVFPGMIFFKVCSLLTFLSTYWSTLFRCFQLCVFSFPYAFLHANILLISQNYVFGSLLLMCCHSVCVHFLVWSLICSDQRHQASLYPHISKSGLLLQFCTVGLSAKIFVLQKMTLLTKFSLRCVLKILAWRTEDILWSQ